MVHYVQNMLKINKTVYYLIIYCPHVWKITFYLNFLKPSVILLLDLSYMHYNLSHPITKIAELIPAKLPEHYLNVNKTR